MTRPSLHLIWLLLAGGSATATAASLFSTAWLGLEPCHLCIFQRLLFMMLTVTALGAAFASWRSRAGRAGRLLGGLTLPISASGIGVAAYQSWLQRQPLDQASCTAGAPGLIERWVEWLGRQMPEWFMATGFCEDEALVILGLSLANWALVLFTLCLATGIWAIVSGRESD